MQNKDIHIDLDNLNSADLLIRLYQSGIQCVDLQDFFKNFSLLLSDHVDFDSILVVERFVPIVDFEVVYSENNTSDLNPLINSVLGAQIDDNFNPIDYISTGNILPVKSVAIINIEREEKKGSFHIFIENSSDKGFSENDKLILNILAERITAVLNKLVFGIGVNFQQKMQNILEFVYDFAIIFDMNGFVLFSNQIAKDKLSLSEDEIYTINALFSDTSAITDFLDNYPYNTKEIYTELISVYGKLYPSRILLTKLQLNNQVMVFAICKDINEEEYYRSTEIRNNADNLLFKNIADFVLNLLGKDNLINSMVEYLPIFSKLLLADRIFLAALESNITDINFLIKVIYKSDTKKTETTDELSVKGFYIPETSRIMESLLENKPVKAVKSECNDDLNYYFNEFECRSIYLIPIFVNNRLAAVFGTIDDKEERFWTGNEENALIIIGNAIAASLERKATFKQLISARESAEEAYKSKSNFLSCMSHEIRTPLNGIIGMAELLHMTNVDEEQLEFIDTIQDSANKLVDVVNDILDLSKIDTGSFRLDKKTFNFRDLVKKTVYTISTEAFKKEIEIIVDVDNNIPAELVGDAIRYRQILINIIGNAVKYTNKGEILISIRKEIIDKNQIAIFTKVSDTGIGIEEDKLEFIFESFSKIDYSTANTNRGTGLGLAISKKLIELMGGSISVNSRLGEGSSFEFKTYFELADLTPIDYSENYSVKQNIKLLIVDDNLTSQSILQKYLSEFSNNITCLHDTNHVIDIVRSVKDEELFDCILIDSSVYNNNAIEFISDLRDAEGEYNQNIILMLSRELTQLEKEFVDGNNVNCIHKPIFPEDLYNFLSNTVIIKHKSKHHIMKNDNIKTEEKKSSNQFTVLVAEDNLFNLKLSITLLKKKNWNIISAENGLEAVKKFKENRVDLVLLDIQMPELNGYEAAKLIREEQEKTKVFAPIIALTAYAMKGDREKALSFGMDEYMAKPLEPNKFYDIINSQIIKYKNKSNPHFIFEDLVKKFSNDPYALRTHLEKTIIHLRQYTTELNDFFNLREFDKIIDISNNLINTIGKEYFPDINNAICELIEELNGDDIDLINHTKNYLIDEVARFIIYYKDTIMPKFE